MFTATLLHFQDSVCVIVKEGCVGFTGTGHTVRCYVALLKVVAIGISCICRSGSLSSCQFPPQTMIMRIQSDTFCLPVRGLAEQKHS